MFTRAHKNVEWGEARTRRGNRSTESQALTGRVTRKEKGRGSRKRERGRPHFHFFAAAAAASSASAATVFSLSTNIDDASMVATVSPWNATRARIILWETFWFPCDDFFLAFLEVDVEKSGREKNGEKIFFFSLSLCFSETFLPAGTRPAPQ